MTSDTQNDVNMFAAVKLLFERLEADIDHRFEALERTQREMRAEIKANELRSVDIDVLRKYVDYQKTKDEKWAKRKEKVAGFVIIKVVGWVLFGLGWVGAKALTYATEHGWFQR